VVPLLAIQMSSRAAAAPTGGGGRAPASARPAGYLPAWQLAADRISTGKGGATTAEAVTQSAVPTTSPAGAPAATVPATTPPTTVPPTTVPPRPPTMVPPPPPTTTTTAPAPAVVEAQHSGIVTYYDDPGGPGTCASPTLPFGTEVTITNPANGATVSCRVNDREADTARQIDLDTQSFAEIAPLSQGVIYGAGLSW